MMPPTQQQPQQAPQPPQNPVLALEQQALQIKQAVQQRTQQLDGIITIDKVVKFLRDERTRSFAIEIETDSTIMVDEAQEKAARNEFLGAFAQASQGVQSLLQAGPSGAQLASDLLKFSLAPYRAGRQLDAAIDQFTEQAPQFLAQQQAQAQGNGPSQEMQQVQQQLAQAELQKSQAQMQKVQADAQLAAAKLQLEQDKAQSNATQRQQQLSLEAQRLQTEVQQAQATLAETLARVEHVKAETMALIANAQTARQTADNDTARAAAETGLQAVQAANELMPPIGDADGLQT